jgi:hypothetical protein
MTAPFDTIQRERVGRGPKASREIALSFHDHQKGGAGSASRRLSRARGHGVVRVNHVVEADRFALRSALTHLLPVELARALSRVLFQPHSHWSRFSSVAVTNRGVSSFSRALPRVHSANGPRPTASVRNSLPHQRLVNRTADRLHHLSDLSYSPSFDGSKTIEKAFRDGRISFGGQQIVFPG